MNRAQGERIRQLYADMTPLKKDNTWATSNIEEAARARPEGPCFNIVYKYATVLNGYRVSLGPRRG